MSGAVSFTIPGKLSGKGRPRFSNNAGRVFTPAKTLSHEAQVKHFAAEAMGERAPLDGPVSMDMRVYLAKPKSWSKKRRDTTIWSTNRPDLDNLAKTCSDAINGIVFRDDAQIACLHAERRYSFDGRERVEIIVTPLAEGAAR